jgi:adenylate cyclase
MAEPARPVTSLTGIAQAATRHNEAQVLVARSLENERRVTAVRLLVLALMGISQGPIQDLTGAPEAGDDSPLQVAAIVVYFVFSVSAFVAVRIIRPRVVTASIMPIVATTFDVGFVAVMDHNDRATGGTPELASGAAIFAVILSYSLLRYSATSLYYSVALVVAAWTTMLLAWDVFTWADWTFVVFAYLALAALIAWMRRGMRKAFVDLMRRENLSKLVPAKVVEEILAGRDDALRPARRTVTILFSDVRGFTTYSESRDPEEVLSLLDDYFGRMTQVVQGHDGTVNKFLGDGLLALWGAPAPNDDHAVLAVKAAIDMQKVVREINERRLAKGEPEIRIGIGIHTGDVAAGMLGGASQTEYAVIGDAVNLASRIEGLTKEHDADILVSEPTWMRLGDRFRGARLGEFSVKGRQAPVSLYSVPWSS